MRKFFKKTMLTVLSCLMLVALVGFYGTVNVSAEVTETPASVIQKIDALGDHEEFRTDNAQQMQAVKEAEEAYKALSAEDQAKVTNKDVLAKFQKIISNSGNGYTWVSTSLDPSLYPHKETGEKAGLSFEEDGSINFDSYSSKVANGIVANGTNNYGGVWFVPGYYYGDIEISFDFVNTYYNNDSRFFYVLAYARLQESCLLGVGANVRAFTNKEAAFICPTTNFNCQDKNFSTLDGNTAKVLTAGTTYNYKMTIVGTQITLTVTGTGADSATVYKYATADYTTLFGATAPMLREGGIIIGASQCGLNVKNLTVTNKQTKVQYAQDTIDYIPSTLTLKEKPAVEYAREVYESLTAEEKEAVANYQDLQAAEQAISAIEAKLPEGWTYNAKSAPVENITKTNGVTTITKTSNPALVEYYGAIFDSGIEVDGDIVVEFKFKVVACYNDSRLLGITYYNQEDKNGYVSGYGYTVRVNGQSALTAFDRAPKAANPTFNDNTVLGSQTAILNKDVTMKLVVKDARVSTYIYYEGNLTEQRANSVALDGMMKNSAVRTNGTIGIIFSAVTTEIQSFTVSSYDEYYAVETEKLIEAIPAIGSLTTQDSPAVEAARALYNTLSDAGKALVENYAVLVAAEEKIAQLAESALTQEEQVAVNEFAAKVQAIGNVTVESAQVIKTAREAYNALTDAAKAAVATQYNVLTEAEVDYYEALVETLPALEQLTIADLQKLEAVREVYNALSEGQKASTSAVTLVELEKKMDLLVDYSNLPEGWTYNTHSAPFTDIYKNGDNTVIKGKWTANPGLGEYWGSIFTSNITVEGNFIAEFKFKMSAWRDNRRLLGITYYTEEDANGYPSGYAFTARVCGESALTAFDRANGAANPTFNDNNIVANQTAINTKEVTMKIIVHDGLISAYLYYEGNLTEQRANEVALDGMMKNSAVRTSGKLGLIVSSLEFEMLSFTVSSYEDYAAQQMIDTIAKLPAVDQLTLEDEEKVEAARQAYDALSVAVQEKVTNYAVLVAAEEKIEELKNANIKAVMDLIAALDETVVLTEEYKQALDNAKQAYDALTEEEQAKVTNVSKLNGLLEEYAQKEQAAQESQARVQNVMDLIDMLPAASVIILEDEAVINAAKQAYDALTEEEQAKVTNVEYLEEAIAKLEELKNPTPPTSEEPSEEPSESVPEITDGPVKVSCGSSLGGMEVGLIALAISGMMFFKKREE